MKIYKRSHLCVVLACFIWSWSSLLASATWWLLTVPAPQPTQQIRNSKGAKSYCNSLRYLTEKQRQLCLQHPTILSKISDGVKVGIRECEHQFENQRWNCSQYHSSNPKQHTFEPILRNKGKERAFVKAILSAAVSYSITRACSGGDLPDECRCDAQRRRTDHDSRRNPFEWGGCSDDIKIGDKFSRDFFDGKKGELSALEILDLHNNEAGRKAVVLNNKTTCRCHGLTGACTQNICWKSLPPMRKVGSVLYERYHNSMKVKIKRSRVQASKGLRNKLSSSDLVYLKNSPSFCTKNSKKGSVGTIGRWCNETSTNTDGCESMCCGRGHRTEPQVRIKNCNCKFHWCCVIECEPCRETSDESYCR